MDGQEKSLADTGELVWWGWKFWENSLQVIYVSLEEFQLMACCRFQVLMGSGEVGRVGVAGV